MIFLRLVCILFGHGYTITRVELGVGWNKEDRVHYKCMRCDDELTECLELEEE